MNKIIGVVLFVISISFAGDWPKYGGPNQNNISTETGLADSWSAEGPKVLWETTVTKGYSGPTIKDGKVYIMDHADDESLLRCLDFSTGKELWKVAFSDPGKMPGAKFDGTRGSPTVKDDAVYLVTGYGAFVCVDLKTRKVKWQHHLLNDYDKALPSFGIAQSPLVYGSMVLVAPNAEKVGVAAFDKETGKRIWTSIGLGRHSYISPTLATLCGQEMILAIGSQEKAPKTRGRKKAGETPPEPKPLEPGHVVGLSPKDGSILWDYSADWQCHAAIPFPTLVSGDRLFITAGYDAGSAMIRIVKKGDGFAVEELYRTDDVGSQLHQPIQVGDYFYIGSNSNSRKDGLACFSLDGKLIWRTKDIDGAPNFERGSFIFADGKLIMLDGKSGILYLVKPDPAGYKQLASVSMVKKNDMAWAPLALSNGKLLVRDWTTLKCVDLK